MRSKNHGKLPCEEANDTFTFRTAMILKNC